MTTLPDDPKVWAAILTAAGAILVAVISVVSAFLTVLTNHSLSKRNEINIIKVNKSYELAEQIAERIQKVDSKYKFITEFWNTNFQHFESFDEGVAIFNKGAKTLYSSELSLINEVLKLKYEINGLVSKSWFYLHPNVILEVNNYLHTGNYSYTSDGGLGLVDDQAKQFFINLLDEKKVQMRNKCYKNLQSKLRKLKI